MKPARAFEFLTLVIATVLLTVLLLPRAASAGTATRDDSAGKSLPAGDASTDLQVTGPCRVKAGIYTFHNVNIYRLPGTQTTGSLKFDDDPKGIDFYAESILIENHGTLVAGSRATPIGSACD